MTDRFFVYLGVTIGIITFLAGPAFPQPTLQVCSAPTVTTETEPCNMSGSFIEYARVSNNCVCGVNVDVKLPGGGTAVFIIEGNQSKRDMIQACGDKRRGVESFQYRFNCPRENKSGDKTTTGV